VARRREGACSSERKHDRTEQEQNERQKKDEDGERIRNVVPAHKKTTEEWNTTELVFFICLFTLWKRTNPHHIHCNKKKCVLCDS